MAGYNPLPPTVLHASTQLTHAQAHALLSSFLERAAIDPAYRPDSTLTEAGPQSNSSSGNPNLTLHHLLLVKHSMDAKTIGIEDLDASFFNRDAVGKPGQRRWISSGQPRSRQREEGLATKGGGSGTVSDETNAVLKEGEGWQDREDYELAQDDEVDVGNAQRDPALPAVEEMVGVEDGMEEIVCTGEDGSGNHDQTTPRDAIKAKKKQHRNLDQETTTVSKEERKRLKKERQMKEKKSVRAG